MMLLMKLDKLNENSKVDILRCFNRKINQFSWELTELVLRISITMKLIFTGIKQLRT